MLVKIEDVKPGTKFSCLGVNYEMVRVTGKVVDAPSFNRWGRRIDGSTYKASKVVVKTDKRHRGWSPAHYMVFPVSCSVIVEAL